MRLSLLGSAVAAVVAGIGGPWLLPVGLVLSVAGGVLACAFAWREAEVTRTTLLAQQGEDSRRSADFLHQLNQRQRLVVGLLSARNQGLQGQLVDARLEAGELVRQTAQLRGDKAALQLELQQRSLDLDDTRRSLGELQAALDAQVVALPEREASAAPELDLWTEDGFPTVVQLQALANPPVEQDDERKHA